MFTIKFTQIFARFKKRKQKLYSFMYIRLIDHRSGAPWGPWLCEGGNMFFPGRNHYRAPWGVPWGGPMGDPTPRTPYITFYFMIIWIPRLVGRSRKKQKMMLYMGCAVAWRCFWSSTTELFWCWMQSSGLWPFLRPNASTCLGMI